MKIRLIEDPLRCPACNTRMTGLALYGRQCNSCGMTCYLVTDETKHTGEQMRLRQSWDAVLIEMGSSELGGSRMVSPPKDILVDGIRPSLDAKQSQFLEPQPVVRRLLHSSCPIAAA